MSNERNNTGIEKNTIIDLRSELFETIKMLKEDEIDVSRANAISDISGRIIDSAKVELQFMKHAQVTKSKFLLDQETREKMEEEANRLAIEEKKNLPENKKFFEN